MKIQKSPYLIVLKDIYNTNKSVLRDLLMHRDFDIDCFELLNNLQNPVQYESAVSMYGKERIDYMLANNLLLDAQDIWLRTNIDSLEIEICSNCNWRCQYCPVSNQPKPARTMPMELFREITDKAAEDGNIKYVTFNSYNEPLLDKYFFERADYLSKTNIKLRLHTNGSLLTKETLDALKSLGVLEFICFNIPSIDKIEFKRMTGSSALEKVMQNIDYAFEIGLPAEFSVQGTREELKRNLKPIQCRYKDYVKDITPWGTYDRAGLLKNKYAQNIYIAGKLFGGCHSVLNWLNISVDGDCFICSNDYYQKYAWANIRDGSIKDICNSPKAVELRRYIFGDLLPGEDFMCRRCVTMKRAKLLNRFQKGET